ncbi:Polynucleotide 5'-hydroxyl-kinase NOL9 [Orchesella cincta]|uniref:Polynucleotide 5'-hydroxyl-kinase NOL9 n=1 Tax=Orchesella cincta TaxID=48709 RepID=A0A1D2NKF3_ORCCI|nr:Polynucleotide 5'-hydroxyl-kinase NOL9 [Orchesella cincta]
MSQSGSSLPGKAYYMTTKKGKKKMLKEMKGAAKTKVKIAGFIEKAERLRLSEENLSGGSEEELEARDEMEIGNEQEASITMDDTSHFSIDVEDDEDEVAAPRPHMRTFSHGILYRKLDCNSILVSIMPPQELYFTGKALIRVVKGVVDVHGFKIQEADGIKYAAFSAKGHSSLQCIKALARNSTGASTVNDSASASHPNICPEELETAEGALIIMEGFENEWCEGMRHIYPDCVNFIGPSITGMGPGKTPQLKTLMDKVGFQFIKKTSQKYRFIEYPPYWEQVFNDLVDKFECSTGIICPFGGKGVGKSTFVRWLTNRFLSRQDTDRVLFLDLDPGQTEFTPPGMLSVHVCSEPILGPNFTHLKEPSRAIFLGGVNVADFPISYIKGVAELFEYCVNSEELQGIPWIINTMGFSQGLGVHLACEIVKIIRPTAVIQLTINNHQRSFPFNLNRQNVSKYRTFLSDSLPPKYRQELHDYHFLTVNSACNHNEASNKSSWGTTPKISRELVMVSYFAEKIGSADGFDIRSVLPLSVPLDCVAIGTMNSNLRYDEILSSMNGTLVAFCQIAESLLESVDGADKKYIAKAGNYTNNCLGYGIVRAIDKQSDTLYVITSLQETDILLKVNVLLAAGNVGLPVHFYISPGAGSSKQTQELPYVMDRNKENSTLHAAAKKFFVPKRVTHTVLKNCLL